MAVSCLPNSSIPSATAAARPAVLCLLLGFLLPSAAAQDPLVDRLDGPALRPGQPAAVTSVGKQQQGCIALWTPVGTLRPKAGSDLSKDQPVALEGSIAANAVPGIYPVRLITNHGVSEAAWTVVDDLPFTALTAEADNRSAGQPLSLPCCLNGSVAAVASKTFKLNLAANQVFTAEVFARRIGSDLDPVLRILGPDGRELLWSDDFPGLEGDSQFRFEAPAAGEYRLELRDVRYSGGARHFFHLRLARMPLSAAALPRIATNGKPVSITDAAGTVVGEATAPAAPAEDLIPVSFRASDAEASSIAAVAVTNNSVLSETEPNSTREQASEVPADAGVISGVFQSAGDADWFRINAPAAGPLLVQARTRDVSSPCDLVLEIFKDDGGKLAESDDAGPRDAELSVQLPAPGNYFVRVTELAGRGGPEWCYALNLFHTTPAVIAAAPSDRLNIPRGGSASLPITLRRFRCDGPLLVEPTMLPAALRMEPFTIHPKQAVVPVTLTAVDPAAAPSDADWGPITLKISAPDGSVPSALLQLNPPPPKKQDSELFRSRRTRADLFASITPV
ncbi:MAG: PPC domain-containing protein, partial [Planctomycetaceae bacterium]